MLSQGITKESNDLFTMEELIISIMTSLTVFTRPYNGHEFPIFKRDTYHKTWRKNLVKIPPTFISYHVTNSITYCVVICFLSFMFVAQCVVIITCYYSLSEKNYNHIVMCHRCKAELLSKWLWINAIYVSRGVLWAAWSQLKMWPLPIKCMVSADKLFVMIYHQIWKHGPCPVWKIFWCGMSNTKCNCTARYTAHAIVLWPNLQQWLMFHIFNLIMLIKPLNIYVYKGKYTCLAHTCMTYWGQH